MMTEIYIFTGQADKSEERFLDVHLCVSGTSDSTDLYRKPLSGNKLLMADSGHPTYH